MESHFRAQRDLYSWCLKCQLLSTKYNHSTVIPFQVKNGCPVAVSPPRSSFYRHPTAFSADHSVWKCDTWSWTIGQPAGHSNPVCRRSSPCILPNLHPGSGSERPTNEAGRGSKILYWCRRPALCWLIPPLVCSTSYSIFPLHTYSRFSRFPPSYSHITFSHIFWFLIATI